MIRFVIMLAAAVAMSTAGGTAHAKTAMQTFPVLAGSGAHDVFPAPDGTVWFTAQSAGELGRLDPRTSKSDLIALGPGAAPHGVIVGPDGAAWVTEGGQNAIARVDPVTRAVKLFPLPKGLSGNYRRRHQACSTTSANWFQPLDPQVSRYSSYHTTGLTKVTSTGCAAQAMGSRKSSWSVWLPTPASSPRGALEWNSATM